MARGTLYSDEETAILREMMAAGRSIPEIMDRLKRSKHSIKERWRWINRTEEDKILRRKQINVNRNIRREFGPGVHNARLIFKREIPHEAVTDRNARFDAGPRDLTGAFFGDPPRGFSALDRKLSGNSEPTRIDRRRSEE